MRGFVVWVALLASATAAAAAADCARTDTDVTLRRLMGGQENLCRTYGGRVLLVVNVASHCGFTPQYEALEQIYQRYRDEGLVVLGFPSADFGGQEFEDEDRIARFCKVNFGVSFPMFGKSVVSGPGANPLFAKLGARTGKTPQWNFNKYLIGRDGRVIAHYPSGVRPDDPQLEQAIRSALSADVATTDP